MAFNVNTLDIFLLLLLFFFFFLTMGDNPNERAAEWIAKNWTAWQKNGGVFGPLTTFTVGAGLLAYALTTGQHSDAVVFVSTALGAGVGLLSAELITLMVNKKNAGWFLDQYGQTLLKYPFMSIIYVTSTGLVGTGLFQIFGGEILDFIPGVDAVALGIQMAVSLGVGIVTLPMMANIFDDVNKVWSSTGKGGGFSLWSLLKVSVFGVFGLLFK